MDQTLWITLILVIVISLILTITGIKKAPGIGILVSLVIVGVSIWLRHTNFAAIGLGWPSSWPGVILGGLLLGTVLSLLSIILVEPLIEKITKTPHDVSAVEGVRGNWKSLLGWLAMVWIVVALIEEGLYRGFLMTEMSRLTGTGVLGLLITLVVSSVVFGLSHSYQGRSGTWSTGIIGSLLGVIFILSGFNLWLAIFTHGFIDTISLILMYFKADKWLNGLIWKKTD
ncbi:MAG TPA: CPBP family intramembrane glutamic endopeptidase [Longilinea sp.]|nr:CPBP family intramembrane glutamic endopeptidase [Longilinea sp.]